MPEPLPIDPYLSEIAARLSDRRALVLTAAPGAGKTTRVPPTLAVDGPVIVLQPRRVAARSLARRIAGEQRWTLGREVGWHVRFERQFSRETRVLLATEGILTARLQQDPLLSGFRTVVLDEFHERTVHADLGLALAKQAWRARDDLRLLVMSATLDAVRVAAYLDGCPTLEVPGSLHAVEVRYMPGAPLVEAVRSAAATGDGTILCFLPGAPEIARAARELSNAPGLEDWPVVPLHGSLPAAEQDAAVAPGPGRRIVAATNIAETSLTVAGVRAVVDSGLQKIARYDPARGIDTLQTERVSLDSAEQRAGRAGRLGPGAAIRLWDRADRLARHREPEILRVDLSGPVLDIFGWGGDPQALDWFDPPPPRAIEDALALLRLLGAVEGAGLTRLGAEMQRLPLHPRLSRILLAARGAREAALACALLSDGARAGSPGGPAPTTASDLLSAIDARVSPHVARTADALMRLVSGEARPLNEVAFRRAVFAGYPDRVAQRRAPGSPRVLLASGHGAVVSDESGVRDAELLVALDVIGGRTGEGSEARIRMASAIERDWLKPTDTRIVHELDEATGAVRAEAREQYGALVLASRGVEPDPSEGAALLARAWLARGPALRDARLWRRLAFAGLDLDREGLVERAAGSARTLDEVDLEAALPPDIRSQLARRAPESLEVPSGRRVRLEYLDDGGVSAEVKLQELFGLADTPRVGPRRVPVLLSLLAPNGRPVQLTRDLRSFWERTYPEVRRELRGRYPKHPWPEDPWTATPTARTVRRRARSGV